MDNKNLYIIINDYPYNDGEPFFESEIHYLSARFDNIYIFSLMGRKKKKQTRNYPLNVKCYPLGCNRNKIKYLLMGLFDNDKAFRIHNIKGKRRLSAYYLLGKNKIVFKNILKIIKHENISFNNVTIYSYWLTNGIASIKIRKFVKKAAGTTPRCISRCHRYDLFSEVMPFNFQPFQKEVIENIDSVYSCSDYGSDYLKAKYRMLTNKIRVSKLGTFDYGIQDVNNETNSRIFVTCSGLRLVKQLDLFAKAFAIAANKYPDIQWLCIGDGEEKDKIVKIVNENNILEHCTFTGNINNEELMKMYSNNYYFCFVNVSKSEGLPVSIMEATSFGIPIIATDVGGSKEIVDNTNGILLSSNPAINEVVAALETMLELDFKKYQQMRVASRNKWNKGYNAEINYKKWCEILLGSKE